MDKTTMRISNSTLTSLCDEFKKNNRIEPEKFETLHKETLLGETFDVRRYKR